MFFNSHYFLPFFYKKWIISFVLIFGFLFSSQSAYPEGGLEGSLQNSSQKCSQASIQKSPILLAQIDAQTVAEVTVTKDVEAVVTFDVLKQQLIAAKLKQIPDIIEQMQQLDAEQALPLFENLLVGELYYRRSDKALFRAIANDAGKYQLLDIATQEEKELVEKSVIKKVRSNNKLRKNLRTRIASLSLFSENIEQRLSSVSNIMNNLDAGNVELLKKAQLEEKNTEVSKLIKEALALSALSSSDANVRLSALDDLHGSLQPVVKNKLEQMLVETSPGQFAESDATVLAAAKKTVDSINGKIELYSYLERIFFGLSLGSILLLVAAGLAITFGVMGVINMAHGELIMLGAYTTYVIQLMMPNHITASIFVAIPAAFLVSALFGILIERGVIQFLKGRPLETLLATFGISLVLQQLVRTIFSPLNRQVITPEFMSGSLQINPVFSLTYNRLYILAFSLIVFFVLLLILKRTSLGLYVRAVSQNRNMAKAMGIRSEWVDAMTFGLGAGIAGLAGVALSQITNVGPNLGQSYIIDSFMVVVFGGVGNLWGTLVGAFTLGSLNKFLEPGTGAVLANVIVLVGIILFIQKKPRGLFPQKGRAAES